VSGLASGPPAGARGGARHWPALHAATAHDAAARLPFFVAGRRVGSVARAHLALLRTHAPWIEERAGALHCDHAADETLGALHAQLRDAGAIVAWRDEAFPLFDPATLEPLANIERAAARFWGTLTLGAHANGYVRGADGEPSHLWIARRSPAKATDPNLLDNLVGGGVPAGQSPRETLVREGFEEAGLAPAHLTAAVPAGVLRLHRDIPEGFQHEWLYSYDLELPPGLEPRNQDGEVAAFALMTADEVADMVAGSEAMTTDAALVTIDFLWRHGLLRRFGDELAVVQRRLQALQVPGRSG
jgi:8-oxo-dGTP pyrophosphatase MutT (NUDIX family)